MSDYDCYCDYDPAEFYWSRKPTARREHRCEECRGKILPGEKYERVTGKWDGYIGEFKTCARCVDLRTWVKNNVPCFCWAHGNTFEDAKEAIDAAAWRAGDEVKGLRFGFARRVQRIVSLNAERRAA